MKDGVRLVFTYYKLNVYVRYTTRINKFILCTAGVVLRKLVLVAVCMFFPVCPGGLHRTLTTYVRVLAVCKMYHISPRGLLHKFITRFRVFAV
jgi:hypothetical protein